MQAKRVSAFSYFIPYHMLSGPSVYKIFSVDEQFQGAFSVDIYSIMYVHTYVRMYFY